MRHNLSDHLKYLTDRLNKLEVAVSRPGTGSIAQLVDRAAAIERNLSAIEKQILTDAATRQPKVASGDDTTGANRTVEEVRMTSENPAAAAAASSAEKISTITNKIIDLNRAIAQLTVSGNDAASMEYRRLLDNVDRKCGVLEQTVPSKDAAIAELVKRMRVIETAGDGGVLIWPIDEFARKRQEARCGQIRSLYSPIFYTSRTGNSVL